MEQDPPAMLVTLECVEGSMMEAVRSNRLSDVSVEMAGRMEGGMDEMS